MTDDSDDDHFLVNDEDDDPSDTCDDDDFDAIWAAGELMALSTELSQTPEFRKSFHASSKRTQRRRKQI